MPRYLGTGKEANGVLRANGLKEDTLVFWAVIVARKHRFEGGGHNKEKTEHMTVGAHPRSINKQALEELNREEGAGSERVHQVLIWCGKGRGARNSGRERRAPWQLKIYPLVERGRHCLGGGGGGG